MLVLDVLGRVEEEKIRCKEAIRLFETLDK